MERRSRYSGRSWCAIVAIVAWRFATCDSSAIVTLSRNRRCTRVLTVRRNHVAVADTARPIAEPTTRPDRCSTTPLPRSISQSASSASGSAASCERTKAATIIRGSWRYPSMHSRHIDDSVGGRGSSWSRRSGENVIRRSLLVIREREPPRLQIEHRTVASVERDQLVVRPELDDAAALEDADAIGMANRGEAMRDQDRRARPRGGKQSIVDLRLAADIELRGRLVEQDDPCTERYGGEGTRQRDALPLSAREVGTTVVSAREHRVERRQIRGACRSQCRG